MSKLRNILLAGSMVVLVPGAMAADIAPAPVADWTGFYLGIGVGGTFSFADQAAVGYGGFEDWYDDDGFSYTDGPLTFEGGCSFYCQMGGVSAAGLGGNASNYVEFLNAVIDGDEDLSDANSNGGANVGDENFFARGEIGADWQVDNFVFGLNAGYNLSGKRSLDANAIGAAGGGIDEINGGEGFGAGGAAALSTSLELDDSWSVGARMGFLPHERVMVYLAGGYAQTKADLDVGFSSRISADGSVDAGGGDFDASLSQGASSSEWLDGFYIGGGLEAMLMDHLSMKVEYRYTDLGSISASSERSFTCAEASNVESCGGGGDYGYIAGVAASADVREHAVFTTLSWRFGGWQ